jgi:hypothetical protein
MAAIVLAGVGIACGVWVYLWLLGTWIAAAPRAEDWTNESTWEMR